MRILNQRPWIRQKSPKTPDVVEAAAAPETWSALGIWRFNRRKPPSLCVRRPKMNAQDTSGPCQTAFRITRSLTLETS